MNYWELILGAIIGWIMTRVSIAFTRAQLTFEIDNNQIFQQGNNRYRFLSIIVKNKPKNIFFLFLNIIFGRVTLDNAKAQVSFFVPTNPNIVVKTITNARWATTKEPIDLTKNLDIAQIIMTSRESIFPEEDGVINIAIKQEGDKSFYGFNNLSYIPNNWPLYPDFKINEKYCNVKVEILSSGKKYTYKCALVNTNQKVENFCLKSY